MTDQKRPLQILLVSEHIGLAERLENIFGESVQVLSASSMREGLLLSSKQEPDVILADSFFSPDELPIWQKLHDLHKDVPLVALLNSTEAGLAEKSVAAGAFIGVVVDETSDFLFEQIILSGWENHKRLHLCTSRLDEAKSRVDRYRTIFEHSDDGLLVVTETGDILYANKSAELLLGKPVMELIGSQYGFPVVPGPAQLMEIIRESGDTLDAEVQIREIPWNESNAFIVNIRDASLQTLRDQEMKKRIVVERLIAGISSLFMQLESKDVDYGVSECLARLGEFVGADRVSLFVFDEGRKVMSSVAEWHSPEVSATREADRSFVAGEFTWLMERLRVYDTAFLPRASDLPLKALNEKDFLLRRDSQSMIAVSMYGSSGLAGFICLEQTSGERVWSEDEIGLLKVCGEILIKALERKSSASRWRLYGVLLDTLLEQRDGGYLICDESHTVIEANRQLCDMFGLYVDSADLYGLMLDDVVKQLATEMELPEILADLMLQYDQSTVRLGKSVINTVHGRKLSVGYTPVMLGETWSGSIWSFHDDTEEIEEQQTLESNIRRDVLTGFSTRQRFLEDMQFLASTFTPDTVSAVLVVGLDDFRGVNANLGFGVGDQVIRLAAARLAECIRPGDIIGRISGDEFAILLQPCEDLTVPVKIARFITWNLAKSFEIEGHTVTIGASVGIACYPSNGTDVEDLFQYADMALKQAKEQGKGNVQVYNQISCQINS